MSRPSPEIEAQARQRLAADEQRIQAEPPERITGARRTSQTLRSVAAAFWRHPSPWLIGGFLLAACGYRAALAASGHGFGWTELIVPVALVALFPVIEWVIHVVILHWRPRKVGGVPVDSLLARKHRAHHADPRVLPLVFIPWQVELWLLPSYVVVALLAFPGQAAGASFLVAVGALMFGYEWVHYLVHSDYRPRTTGVPGRVAQPPAAPLQERALLVHGHHGGHRRPAVRDLPRRGRRADLRNRPQPALAGGGQALSRTAQLLR